MSTVTLDTYMADMCRAIRLQLERHGGHLRDIPTKTLDEYVAIAGAFYGDLSDEQKRREEVGD